MAAMPGQEEFTLKATGRVARRQAMSRGSRYVLLGATLIAVAALIYMAIDVAGLSRERLSWNFLTSYDSRRPVDAGARAAMFGWFWLVLTTVALAIPLAVGTAVFLEEFAPKGRLTNLLRLNISNLAGVPSIIYGILGLAVFVRGVEWQGITLFPALGATILAGALTLVLMILPMTIIASVEALRQVPPSIRQGSLALGATRWQTVWHHTLPGAVPGIMTGTILGIARAAGETAALIMIGAFAFITFDNKGADVLNQNFTTLPIQIYSWTIDSRQEFQKNAAAGIIVLMAAVLSLNFVAALIRERFRNN